MVRGGVYVVTPSDTAFVTGGRGRLARADPVRGTRTPSNGGLDSSRVAVFCLYSPCA